MSSAILTLGANAQSRDPGQTDCTVPHPAAAWRNHLQQLQRARSGSPSVLQGIVSADCTASQP